MIIKPSIENEDPILFVNEEPVAYIRGSMIIRHDEYENEEMRMYISFTVTNINNQTIEKAIDIVQSWCENKKNIITLIEKNGSLSKFYVDDTKGMIGNNRIDVVFGVNSCEFGAADKQDGKVLMPGIANMSKCA